jgi:hypothetical protein
MISLCITGHSAAAIAAAQVALTAAGMAPARGLERNSHINFSSWHERVYQALEQSQPEPGEDEDDSTPDATPATIGLVWEQLANDLFLANMDAKVWGWADAKSLGLLDFWLELDASTHFVLLATPPEQFLTEHLAQLAQEPGRSLQDLPIDSLMDQWQQAHQTMLHFALHHPKRCVLLLAELPLPADALVQAVKGAWARKLKALRAEPADAIALDALPCAEPAAALLRHFAAELCQAYPQAQSLQHEMASVALALPAPAIGAPQTLLDSVLSTVSLASQLPALLRQLPALERKAADAEQQRNALAAARDAETAAKAEALQQRDAFEQQLPRLKDAEEEGELLLAQLHQVQEELERCYLRNKDLEATAVQAGQRISRMVFRKADGIDWESLHTEVESGPGGAQLRCRATHVAVVGKAWDALEFTAHMHQGALAFTFSRRPGAPAMPSRWPAGAGEQWTATVDEAGAAALKEMSTSDWDLLHGLPKLLTHGLQQAKGPWPRGAAAKHWLEAARATLPALQRQPMAVRVDALRLRANCVLAGREYLVLQAEQLTLAHKRFAALEFRLGCNLGPKGEFGQTARLEFFKGSAPATFDQWAPNVQDPAGDRLDLVFVFPGAMNLKDWAALSVNDRGLVLLLADQLPVLLADLQIDAIRMTRPLRDWIALAERVRSFVRQRLDVTGVQQAAPAATPAAKSRKK